ncbi:MAG TPA: branched-chain amino acid ABC transporter substrate-binding protein [Symbiobacteriaceae bacterium]|nr:branched-chain amino acid ABC transporter substrate-binding protein [Symbiobacteriaceae bacterium]
MRRFRFIGALLALLLLAGCSAQTTQLITIASLSPLKAGNIANGTAIRNGAEMALLEEGPALANLGITLRFTALDDEGNPDVGPAVTVRAVKADPSLLAIVGTYNSGVVIPTSAAIKPYNVAIVSPANTGVVVTDRLLPNVNRIVGRDDLQGAAVARFVRFTLQAPSLYIVHDELTYGAGFADQVYREAQRLGLKVDAVAEITHDARHPADPELKVADAAANEAKFKKAQEVVEWIATANSPAVFYGGEVEGAALIVRLMREKGLKAAFISGDGIDNSSFQKIAGAASDGVYYTTVANPVYDTAAGRVWADRYKAQYKSPPEAYAVYGYDSMMVILKAITDWVQKNPGRTLSREAFMTQVRQTSGFVGIATQVTFDHKGDNRDAQLYLLQVQRAKRPYPGFLLGNG